MVAKFLSVLFHPIFAPIISIYILFQLPIFINYKLTAEWTNFIYGVIAINLIISPILINLYLKKKGIIKSLHMEKVEERILPYIITSLFYFFTYFLFQMINFPEFYLAVFKGAIAVVVILLICAHLKFKMSAHLASLGGICGMLFTIALLLRIDTSLVFIISILISGAVASARYYLKAHSFHEMTTGYLVGFIVQVLFLTAHISG